MNQPNPYAPPREYGPAPGASGGDAGTNAIRQADVCLVPAYGAVMPDRCVVCNAPAGGYRLKKTFYWHHPALYLTILLGALIYVIAAMIVRKSATVALGLCDRHRARRRNALILAWTSFLLGLVLLFVGAASMKSAGEIMLAAVAIMIVLPITGGLLARVAYPTRIDDHWMSLKVGQPFLDSLPPG